MNRPLWVKTHTHTHTHTHACTHERTHTHTQPLSQARCTILLLCTHSKSIHNHPWPYRQCSTFIQNAMSNYHHVYFGSLPATPQRTDASPNAENSQWVQHYSILWARWAQRADDQSARFQNQEIQLNIFSSLYLFFKFRFYASGRITQ